VKSKIFIVALVGSLLAACAALNPKPRLLYGLSDSELDLLGQHLGYRVEALGMGSYSFTRRDHTFHVQAHYHQPVMQRDPSAGPVVLRYHPPGRRTPVEFRIVVAGGITFDAAEDYFRHFLRQSHLPASPRTNT